ncbi:unnamed protein product [Clonostachys rosea f. rosea IK726]|uniref:DNA mismatch repair proteins mutS family domain-containing protein n=2 Tax=Bionectria ochroleuca TaxID=29856 RepID=A0A0B7JQS6_BIOOC|nr:unnamed protein product [Clonostachys rosea f. rosea IK726]
MIRANTTRAHGTLISRACQGLAARGPASRWPVCHSLNPAQSPFLVIQRRGKKTKTVIQISDLPQGVIKSELKPVEETQDEPSYPTVVLQAKRNMEKFDNCVLLTRVGGFYELYFEHAEEYGPLLNLKVASKKTNAGPVPMSGFPFFQLDRFLKILVQDLSRYVAIAEEFPNDAPEKIKSGGLMHDRRVTRIITPGTLIDENFIDPYANNYVLAIHVGQLEEQSSSPTSPGDAVQPPRELEEASVSLGLAWLDISTGHFFTQAADLSSLPSILSRVGPREVVLDQRLEARPDHGVFSILAEDRHLITYSKPDGPLGLDRWVQFLESDIPKSSRDAFTDGEVRAGDLALHYVKDRLQGMSIKLQAPLRYENMNIMNIDKNSMRALEINQTIRDGLFRGSLLHAIRRTVTKSGARLLKEWLCSPSTSLNVIQSRQDLVSCFVKAPDLQDSIITLLRRSHDSQRLVQKFALGRGDPDDLLALANTIRATEDIVNLLNSHVTSDSADQTSRCISTLLSRISLEGPVKLAKRIRKAIDEEGVVIQHEAQYSEASQMIALAQDVVAAEGTQEDAEAVLPKGKKRRPTSIREHYAEDNESWIMRPAASRALQKLHAELAQQLQEKIDLNEELRERFGAASLTLRWTPALGHIAHVKGKDTRNLTDIKTLSASRSTRSFHLSEWTSLGQRLDQVRFHIRAEEQRVFHALRAQVVMNLIELRRNAAVLDELDIATAFAKLATEQNLGRSFVRNDCLVGSPSHGRLWLITGPNMAGKSTFLRQNALITILAQVGCYVPASYAEIGIVDAIFSRVGSADNLYRDQSTFMVEMLETAQILKNATPRSLVIMDEIGRGTTPEDGTAVSYACLHHLVTVNQCRTLFATHFHEVADLASAEGLCREDQGAVRFYCTDVQEDGRGVFIYIHKLREGINRQSHALKVARLAGLPAAVIAKAEHVLSNAVQTQEGSTSTE